MAKKRKKPIKKTVVNLDKTENHNEVLATKEIKESKIINLSKTEFLLKSELKKDLVLSGINVLLNELIKADFKEKEIVKQKIRELLLIYNEKNLKNAYDILNIKSIDDIYDQDRSIRTTKDYKAFVYYFWNPENMNFRIIGLHEVNPLFEIMDTKELYFLDKPTMSTLGKPIYWITKGIPFSREIHHIEQEESDLHEFCMKGYNAAELRAMVDSAQFIRIYGKQRLPFRLIITILAFMIIEALLCHIIYTGFLAIPTNGAAP